MKKKLQEYDEIYTMAEGNENLGDAEQEEGEIQHGEAP